MHVTGGTLQLEQTELTATQLDTNAAGGKKKTRKCLDCFQPSQVTRLKGTFARPWNVLRYNFKIPPQKDD